MEPWRRTQTWLSGQAFAEILPQREARRGFGVVHQLLDSGREGFDFYLRPFVADEDGAAGAELFGGLELLATLAGVRGKSTRWPAWRSRWTRASASGRRSSLAMTTYASTARSAATHSSMRALAAGVSAMRLAEHHVAHAEADRGEVHLAVAHEGEELVVAAAAGERALFPPRSKTSKTTPV